MRNTLTLQVGRRASFEVTDFAEASARYAAMRDESGEGGSTFPDGVILNDAGEAIARISYNGRVWAPGAWQPGTEPLYAPPRVGYINLATGEVFS